MRIVHTSDWHLGRSFGGEGLHAAQEAFLSWLVALVRAERATLVVVAGDVYDRAVPAAESVELFGWALRELRGAGARVVAIAGNHDSPERLGAYDGLTDAAGVHIRGGYRRADAVVRVEDDDGPLDVVAIPFLDPALAPEGGVEGHGEVEVELEVEVEVVPSTGVDALPFGDGGRAGAARDAGAAGGAGGVGEGGRPTHRTVLERALAAARRNVRARRSVAVAHAFVAGATSSESERTLSVGGSALVPASLFGGFSYAALGHLHRPQVLAERVRYSGSPLPYSFGELHAKQVVLVDVDAVGDVDARPVEIDGVRPVATVRGTLDELLRDARFGAAERAWVRAELTDPTYVLDAKARLQARFPHVVEVVLEPRRGTSAGGGAATAVSGRSPLRLATDFWEATSGTPASPEVARLLAEALVDAGAAAGVDVGIDRTDNGPAEAEAEVGAGVEVEVGPGDEVGIRAGGDAGSGVGVGVGGEAGAGVGVGDASRAAATGSAVVSDVSDVPVGGARRADDVPLGAGTPAPAAGGPRPAGSGTGTGRRRGRAAPQQDSLFDDAPLGEAS